MEAASARSSDKQFRCQRSGKDVPLRDPRCPEPTAYCKWRRACPVDLLEKEQRRAG